MSEGARRFNRQIVIRVDDGMYEALVADAAAHGRTVTQSVRFHLRGVLERKARR